MRFLFDAHQLGLRQTGNETWCRNVVRYLEAHLAEHQVEYAVTAHGVGILRDLTDAPYHLVSPRSLQRLSIDVPRIVRRRQPNALFSQYTMALGRTPSVVMVQDLSPLHPEASGWMPLRTRLRFRASVWTSARYARRLLAPSEFTRQQLVAGYGLDPSTVLLAPCAVDTSLAALLKASARVEPKEFCVLSVGNVLPRKNLVTVAKAVRRQRERGMKLRYRIVGPVPSEGLATERELRAILPSVEITGFVTSEALAREYLSASLLAMPSLFEGYGIPIIEAMTAGLPVLCSDAACLPEVGGDAALILPASDVSKWARAIETVAHDRDVSRDLVARGRIRVTSFDWNASAHTVANSFLEAARAAPRSALPSWRR